MASVCHQSRCREYTNHYYCRWHRCEIHDCENPVQRGAERCINHRDCKKVSCRNYRVPELDAPFCEEHDMTCEKPDCFGLIGDNDRSPYCHNHSCRWEGCDSTRLDEDGPPYCDRHGCCIYDCHEPAIDRPAGFSYCGSHACQRTGCAGWARRAGDPSDESPFCTDHGCRAWACPARREDGRGHCSAHGSCGKTGCTESREIEQRFCSAHSDTCAVPSCMAAPRVPIYRYKRRFFGRSHRLVGYGKFCDDHTCRSDGCENAQQVDQGRRYCEDHDACGKTGCGNSRSRTDDWCGYHQGTCALPQCVNVCNYESPYCQSHACPADGCSQAKSEGSWFCPSHCYCGYREGCTAICKAPVMACGDHVCRRKGCLSAAYSEETQFCRDDVCAAAGCFEGRQNVFDSGETHAFCVNHRNLEQPRRTRRRHGIDETPSQQAPWQAAEVEDNRDYGGQSQYTHQTESQMYNGQEGYPPGAENSLTAQDWGSHDS